MRFTLGYAGLPAGEAFDYINKKRDSLLSANSDFVGFPMSKKEGLSANHAKLFLTEFKSRLDSEFDKQSNLVGTCCAVIYRRSNNGSDIAFENHFFPAILPVPINWEPSGTTPDERRAAEKCLFETLVRTTARTREILAVLHRELRDQANTTPLLLPVRNFKSNSYRDWLRELQTNIAASNDEQLAKNVLNAATNAFEASYPRVRGSGEVLSFHDDRGIEFKAPGASRRMHGRPWMVEEHPEDMCHLAGFRRLGAPFNAAFHYDAQKNSPKKLTGRFCQCHGDLENKTGDPHLNIAPGDFTRI
ncbi:hypothetical protein [Rhodoferax sp.]|uniref:hypothetical protein n=1 Tax=Rhodoferax sp. TaxID=50421 RepID=UPI002ACE7F72|nr:hypothetical protein [Rhodoferax sp.]MDZ7920391.1 hypothetical protein [Rhodoferax sp.]